MIYVVKTARKYWGWGDERREKGQNQVHSSQRPSLPLKHVKTMTLLTLKINCVTKHAACSLPLKS